MNEKIKIITICGSLKFKEEMMRIATKMQLEGNCILTPIFSKDTDKSNYNEEQINIMGKMHREKIKISDAIFVVNINGYIGNATKSEIEYAKKMNKEIIYLE